MTARTTRGIFPPLLADKGIVAAPEAHIRKVGASATAEAAWLGAALGLLDQQVKGTLHLRAVDEPYHRSDNASKRPVQIHVKGDAAACLGGFAPMIEVHR